MSTKMEPATTPPQREGEVAHEQITARPGAPKGAGYAETRPSETTATNQPHPDEAGSQAAQVAAQLPGEEDEEAPDDTEETPPGEHKREPIKDPDPADTKLHVDRRARRA